MLYLSCDIETSALNPNHGQILEFAAVLEDSENPLPVEILPKFCRRIKLDDPFIGDPIAIEMNADLIAGIQGKKNGPPIIEMHELFDQLTEWSDINVVAGKCFEGFDKKWLVEKEPRFENYFHRRVLDPTSMFVRTEDETPPNLTTCLRRAGFVGPTNLHSAVADALDVIRCVRSFWGIEI